MRTSADSYYHHYLLIIRAFYQFFAVSGCFCIPLGDLSFFHSCATRYNMYTGSGTIQIGSCEDSHSCLRFPRHAGEYGVWGVEFEFE